MVTVGSVLLPCNCQLDIVSKFLTMCRVFSPFLLHRYIERVFSYSNLYHNYGIVFFIPDGVDSDKTFQIDEFSAFMSRCLFSLGVS